MKSSHPSSAETERKIHLALERIAQQEADYIARTVGELVSLRARTHGDRVAIDIFERGERATYAELDRGSNRIARALINLGVLKGDNVGVMMPNRLEYPQLWFALAKVGAVIVPINMRYTSREVAYVLQDSNARYAFIDESAWSVAADMQPWPSGVPKQRVICVGTPVDPSVGSLQALTAGVDDSPIEASVGIDDLLNIQYTSGTTGFPKGCMLTHDYWGVMSYQAACWDFRPYDRYLSGTPLFYTDGKWHLLRSYLQGGTLFLASQLSSSRFIGWIKQLSIEWCQFPELMTRQPVQPDDGTTTLKQITHFGWSTDTARAFRSRFAVRGQEGFAMTEVAFATQLPNDIDEMYDSGSVGIRSPFREVKLVAEDGGAVPVGNIGEMWVRGRSIFRGYWAKPDATAAAFDGDWFKTGDLFRQDERGFLWLVGRTKDMIRRSSENIAAREVEAVIRELPEIADVAALPVKDIKRGEEVKICIELKQGLQPADLPVDRILDHARARLAAFKVPRYISFVSAFPRTVSNKVVKRELAAVADPLAGSYDSEERRWR